MAKVIINSFVVQNAIKKAVRERDLQLERLKNELSHARMRNYDEQVRKYRWKRMAKHQRNPEFWGENRRYKQEMRKLNCRLKQVKELRSTVRYEYHKQQS